MQKLDRGVNAILHKYDLDNFYQKVNMEACRKALDLALDSRQGFAGRRKLRGDC